MTTHRTVRRPLARFFALSALILLGIVDAAAEIQRFTQPVKRHPSASIAPSTIADVQIARLRQTADQLRVLARQAKPTNASPETQTEHLRHGTWLLEAEHRLSTLANQWEQRMKPLHGAAAGSTDYLQATDLNGFFQTQMATLQARLRQESLTQNFTSTPIRGSSDTARMVIENMPVK